jgi:hypothetical protein
VNDLVDLDRDRLHPVETATARGRSGLRQRQGRGLVLSGRPREKLCARPRSACRARLLCFDQFTGSQGMVTSTFLRSLWFRAEGRRRDGHSCEFSHWFLVCTLLLALFWF